MKSPLPLILLLTFLVSCTSPEERALEYTLTFAGTNRAELEKVLHHYKDESATKMTIDRTEYDKHPVPPGQTMDLKVKYEAEESGRFTKVVTVYSNAETSPVRLRIKGDVK